MEECIRVCFYRDCRSSARFHIAVVNNQGSEVQAPRTIESNWEFARGIRGYE